MNRSTNFNLYLPENSDYRDISQFSWNFETIDTELGRTKNMAVNTTAFSTVADLVTYISGFANGARMMVGLGPGITASFFRASDGTTATAIIFKINDNNAYYWAYTRDNMACGNVNLSNSSVSIKRSTYSIGVRYTATTIPDKTIASNTATEIGALPELEAGDYIITITGSWAADSNGYRSITLSEEEGGAQINVAARTNVSAVSGTQTRQQVTVMYKATAATTLHVVGLQNSGSSLNIQTRYAIARVM